MTTTTRRDWPTTLMYFALAISAGIGGIIWSATEVITWLSGQDIGPMDAVRASFVAVYDEADAWRQYATEDRVYAALPLVAGIPLALVMAWFLARAGGVAPPAEKQIAGKILSTDDQHAGRTAADESHGQRGEGIAIHPSIRISRDRETRGIGVVGGVGGGKTTILRPLILAAMGRGDRMIVLDIKGDYTAGLLDQPRVATLSPWDTRAIAWDLAADINTTSAAEEFAARVIPTAKGDNPMWSNGARSILTGAIVSQMRTNPDTWTLADVGSLIVSPYSYFRDSVVSAYPACAAFLPAKPTNTTTSFLANLGAFLAPIYKLADAWSAEGHGDLPEKISLRDWITSSSGDVRYQCLILGSHGNYEQTARGLAQAVLGYLRAVIASPDLPDDSNRRIWLMLDEFVQLGKIEGFERFVEIGRSKGVCVVFGTQDISQFRQHYGPDIEKTWTASVGTWVIARSQGAETQKWLAEMVAKKDMERTTKSTTRGSWMGGQVAPTETTSVQVEPDRWVIRPEEFAEDMGLIKDERGVLARVFGADFEPGIRAHLFCPDWHHVYRIVWPLSELPGRAPGALYAPWALPGWPDSSAAAQAALAEAGSLISPDGGDSPASDEDDDGEPIRPPTPPRLPAGGATTAIPANPAIDADLLPIFDDPAPAQAEPEGAHEGALEALGEKAAEDAAENLIADTLGDDVAHAAELAGHVIDALDAASPGSSDAPRIVTRADAIRARREAQRAQEQEAQDRDHDGPEPGQ